MSVQTQPAAPVLDATDFQHTHNGTTWGLKVRYVPTPDGASAMDVVVAEKVSGGWTYKASIVQDAFPQLSDLGVPLFLAVAVLPALNAWLKSRFSGAAPAPAPAPTPGSPMELVTALDAALFKLTVDTSAGYPQVKA